MKYFDIKQIQSDFNKVITYSQSITNPQTDKLFEGWLKAKKDFIEGFDGNLIYEWPQKVSFELDEKEKHSRVMNFIQTIDDRWGYNDLANFIEKQEKGFFDNITISDYLTYEGKLIKKGSKLVRAFRNFITNSRSLEDIQNEASRIIQEDKVEGTLCLSVHPLDYLSLSENTYNWRSCHSLDGEYRAGNISYMLDKATVVCYLKSDTDTKLPHFPPEVPWNSKKWRVLIYVSEDKKMVFAGRQYPLTTTIGIDFVLKELLSAGNICQINEKEDYLFGGVEKWSNWNNTYIKGLNLSNEISVEYSSMYIPVGKKLLQLKKLVKDAPGSKQFNDVLHSSCYEPIYSVKYYEHPWGGNSLLTEALNTKFIIGGFTPCLKCGESECMSSSDSMMCADCELKFGNSDSDMFTYCDCCGQKFFTEESYSVGNEVVCPHCLEKYCRLCEHCGQYVFEEDTYFYEESSEYLCNECYNNMIENM